MDQPAPVIPTMHLTTADLPEDRGIAIAAAWHMNGAGDLLWIDIQQLTAATPAAT